jgi:hypothetical protein
MLEQDSEWNASVERCGKEWSGGLQEGRKWNPCTLLFGRLGEERKWNEAEWQCTALWKGMVRRAGRGKEMKQQC